MQLDKAADERQADSESALSAVECPIGLHIHVKNERHQLGRGAEPRILYDEHGVVAVGAQCHAYLAICGRVLDCIGQDVAEHLLEPHGVCINPDGLGADGDVPIQPGVAGKRGDGPAYRLGHVERPSIQPDFSGDHALSVEQVVDEM